MHVRGCVFHKFCLHVTRRHFLFIQSVMLGMLKYNNLNSHSFTWYDPINAAQSRYPVSNGTKSDFIAERISLMDFGIVMNNPTFPMSCLFVL